LVLGGFWNTESAPPYAVQNGKCSEYSIRTPGGIELLLYDEDKKQTASLSIPSGAHLMLDDGNKAIRLQDKDGNCALTMDLGKGEVAVKAPSKIMLDVGGTQIILEKGGNISIKGNGTVKMEGANISSKATASLSLDAA